MKTTFLYTLSDPETGKIRYLGKSDNLDEVPVSQWQFWEREYIRVFRVIGMPLTNQCDGGEGTGSGDKNPFFGKRHTEETKKTIREKRKLQTFSEESRVARSLAMTGEGNHFFGETHTEESLKKIRAVSRAQDKSKCGRDTSGEKNPFFGQKHSEETLQKLRKPKTEEHRKNLRAALLAYNKRVKL